ncbi:hypothetical protein DHB64_18370, partial [Antarcticibacterium sp. W02-3]|nr:hypothetical protein [Antarcticibacterium sp. W02-3]
SVYYYSETCTSFDPSGGGGCKSEDCGPTDPESIPTIPTEGDPEWDTGAGGGGDNTSNETNVEIISTLTGKAKCVFDKLNGGNLFMNTIGKFENNDNYILKIERGVCSSPSADGCTNGSDIANGNVTIKIQNIGNANLDLALLILHEGIHAEIYKYVYEHNTGVDPSERRTLLNYYFQYGAQNGLDVATTHAQH